MNVWTGSVMRSAVSSWGGTAVPQFSTCRLRSGQQMNVRVILKSRDTFDCRLTAQVTHDYRVGAAWPCHGGATRNTRERFSATSFSVGAGRGGGGTSAGAALV